MFLLRPRLTPALPSLTRFALAAGLALAGGGAWAQATPPAGAASAPVPVLVTPSPAALASTNLETLLTLKEVAQQAVLSNPEVLARWHTIRAAESERDVARGGLLPRVDLSSALGPERRNGVGEAGRYSSSISLTQLLFDGFATRNEVLRLDYAARVRLFEFFETSENVALEAVRAYLDVLRYRELVKLAEDNFVQHRMVYVQIDRRVAARVARGVDLEQITGRLALADANLMTELSNLHDTSARFQRLVGRLPTRNMPLPDLLARDIPPDAAVALALAQQRNPSLLASIENVRAAQAALATREGAFMPRVDARVRREQGGNSPVAPSSSNATAAELVISWNLFSGFADRSRQRQFAEQLNVARDLRDKTCRDTRQTLIIAFNDINKLGVQLDALQEHQSSVANALVAYRQQFDIGQRTLLDLLDTENELFQARRSVVNARYDLHMAHARTHAGLGTLLRALELSALSDGSEADIANWSSGSDAARECPAAPVLVPTTDRAELVQRAAEQAVRMGTLNARERAALELATPSAPSGPGSTATISSPGPAAMPSPGPAAIPAPGPAAIPAPGPAGAQTPRPAPAPAPPAPGAAVPAAAQVAAALESWRAARAGGRIEDFLGAYAPGFAPPRGLTRQAWERRHRAVMARATSVRVELENVATSLDGRNRAVTTFVQHYTSPTYRDTVRKTLEWVRVDGQWRIRAESTAPVR